MLSGSDFIRNGGSLLKDDLKALHTPEPTFGRFGSEITLYKFPDIIDMAGMLANRGLFLEITPMLRLSVEMIAWAICVFNSDNEEYVTRLKAQSCISTLKRAYSSAGRVYGYVSKFSHWEQVVHPFFLNIQEEVGVIRASRKYRALSSALCLVIIDLFIEAIRYLYGIRANSLILNIQETEEVSKTRKTYRFVNSIAEMTNDEDIMQVRDLLI
jgi:hypothetical protein